VENGLFRIDLHPANPYEPQQNAAQQAPPNDNLQMELDSNHDEAPAAPGSRAVPASPHILFL
jgi:hypothetical protein